MDIKDLDALVERLRYARETYEQAKLIASEAHEDYKTKQLEVLDALKQCGKSKYHVDGIGTVYTISKYTVKTPQTLKQKRLLSDWISNKYGKDVADDMFGINYNTLNSFVKNEYAQAEDKGDVAFKIPGLEDPQIIETIRFKK